ncbi:MAG TPA: EI24 domain-containing protein [Paucimonas sp.]|nr:EI24 domain-containing protein [Paucimonas sp.]HJW56232.1 EI24 domain-containing protein [Burkholderiaceae bacterium]
MRPLLQSFGRALLSQLHYRMLLLTLMPFFLSVVIWAVILWFALQPMIDWLQAYFVENDGFRIAGSVLGWMGLGAIKAVIVPLIAMWVLLPLMIVTALIFIGVLAMPVIVRHVSSHAYPALERRHGGSLWGSVWIAFSSFIVFLLLWLVTLPLAAIPPLGFLVQPTLWGWLTYRVMAYDALADHADARERKAILRIHRWPLLIIGSIAGVMGTAPTLLWLGGALSVIFFPVLAAVSIWLYVLVFIFTGLWFQYYCLTTLESYRKAGIGTAIAVSSGQGTPDNTSLH